MPFPALSGQAQTVLGPIAGEAMGITLPHEHLLIDFEVMFREPANGAERGLARQPVSLANLGWVPVVPAWKHCGRWPATRPGRCSHGCDRRRICR